MTSYPDNVFQAFDELIKKHRFVPVKVGASKGFASLVRRESEDVYTYIFVTDGRPSGANLNVDVWIAPPDEPGDGLESLYVGFKVRIGSEYDIDDAYFISCQSRIIHFLSCIPAIVPLVRHELEEPSFRAKRWTVYRLQRSSLATLLSNANSGDAATIALIEIAKRLAAGKGSLAKLKEAAMPIAATLIDQNSLDKSAQEFFAGNTRSLASTLAVHLYVRELGELSRSNLH